MNLPLIGRAAELVTFSPFGLWLTFPDATRPETSPGNDYVLRIEGPFRFMSPTAVVEVDPNDGPNSVYLGLLQRVVDDAVATEDGALAIRFVDGDRLEIDSGRYESWMLTGNGQSVVSVAGGGLARSGPG
jgi:hypothetical protein